MRNLPTVFRGVMMVFPFAGPAAQFLSAWPEAAAILLVVIVPWVIGPVVTWLTHSSTAQPSLMPYQPDGAEAPVLIRRAVDALKPLGFVHLGTFRSLNQVRNVNGLQSLYFNPTSLDVAKVIVVHGPVKKASFYVFVSELSDGQEIGTSNITLPIITPPVGGKVRNMSFPGIDEPGRLYAVHQARVKNRPKCRPKIDDPYAYVFSKETRALNNFVARGYYYRSANGRRLFPTWKGALLMSWKSLWPVPLLRRAWRRLRAWVMLRRLAVDQQGTLFDAELDAGAELV